MRLHVIAPAACLLAALSSATIARPAAACGALPEIEFTESLDEPITGIPTRGLVPVFATVYDFVDIDNDLELIATAPDGSAFAGALEYTAGRLIWRADTPLQPNTTYIATVRYLDSDLTSFSFVTAPNDEIPALELSNVAEPRLRERHQITRRICCDEGMDTCGQTFFDHCWNQEARSQWVLSGSLSFAAGASRFYRFDATGEQAATAAINLAGNSANFYAIWDDRRTDYCATVAVRSFGGGEPETEIVCGSDEARETIEPFAAEEPEWEQCEGTPVDPDTGAEVEPPGGCSVAGQSAPVFPLLALLALLRRKRR